MVTKVETIGRLKKEREYEDKLAEHLKLKFLDSVNSIKDISDYERKRLIETLNIIVNDSIKNTNTFDKLLESIEENGEDNY